MVLDTLDTFSTESHNIRVHSNPEKKRTMPKKKEHYKYACQSSYLQSICICIKEIQWSCVKSFFILFWNLSSAHQTQTKKSFLDNIKHNRWYICLSNTWYIRKRFTSRCWWLELYEPKSTRVQKQFKILGFKLPWPYVRKWWSHLYYRMRYNECDCRQSWSSNGVISSITIKNVNIE